MKNRVYATALNPRYDGYQRGLASMICMFFDKKTRSGMIVTCKEGVNVNKMLAQELHKALIKKFKKGKSMWSLKIIFRQQI